MEEGGIAKQISAEELGRVYVVLKTKSILSQYILFEGEELIV